MKKIALLMGGEYRTFEECFYSWKNVFSNHAEFDVFLSTWDSSNLYSDRITNLPNNQTFPVDPFRIKKIVQPHLKFLNVEKEINFSHRGNKQIYHWHRLITQLINYKDLYELVILTRPDVRITNPNLNFLEEIKKIHKARLYGPTNISITPPTQFSICTVHDIYFIGTPDIIIEKLLTVPYMKTEDIKLTLTGRGTNFHNHLAKHFINNNHHVLEFMPGSIRDSSWILRESKSVKK